MQERKDKARLIFEHRSNVSHDDLNQYILGLLERTDCEINKNALASWEVLNKNQSKNLQVADSINGATFAAFEEDEYGFVEPTYIKMLSKYFYRRGENLASYGLKLFPLSCTTPQMQQTYPWLKDFK
ncbi:MAG: hypothetical protein AB1796_02540 [Bacillota bacterium]